MKDDTKEVAGLLALAAFLFLLSWVGYSYLEARAYERVTGKPVSTFDAMFLDLRVQAEPSR